MFQIKKKLCIISAAAIAVVFSISFVSAAGEQTSVPSNLGGGLKALVEQHQAMTQSSDAMLNSTQLSALTKQFSHVKLDAQQRALVNIYLDGSVPLTTLKQQLSAKGLIIVGEAAWYRKGALSAWMPLSQGTTVGTLAGVRSVHLEPGMRTRAGQTETQGSVVMNANHVQKRGYTGRGIKIGALSDSFALTAAQDKNGIPDTAAYDVARGDLPVVEDIQDMAIGVPTDEGRGMLQLIHDVAPDASLAFATANGTQVNFANNIRALGSPTSQMVPVVDQSTGAITNRPGVGCQIVCDDVIYFVEPMYSDGLIAQAIDDIATQYGVVYFSSAGNDGNEGYESNWRPVTSTTGLGLATTAGSNHPALTGFPAAAQYAGGFHNFNPDPNGPPMVVQKVNVGSADAPLVLQWNDPYDNTLTGGASAITTNYNVLVFDSTGAYQSSMSGTDNNYSTNEPYEYPSTSLTAGGTFYICITRASATAGITPVADRFRYVAPTNGGGFSGDFIGLESPSIYGHTTAANCISTAAYVYDNVPNVDANGNVLAGTMTPGVESFSSNGPVDIYFDRAGNRLAQPAHRLQPAISAPDGGNTTFFPPVVTNVIPPGGINLPPLPVTAPADVPVTIGRSPADYDGDGWPNFFGTSAAAPHAAAATALILQAANDHGLAGVNPSYVRSLLQSTTQGQMDTAPGFCQATANGTSGLTVTLSGTGDNPSDPNTFHIAFAGPSGYRLSSVVVDLRHSGLEFDPDPVHGAPFAQGTSTGGATLILPPLLSNNNQVATLNFTSFDSGDSVGFGVDRDVAGLHAYGNGTDQLEGSTFTATITNNNAIPPTTQQITGTFSNSYNQEYNFKAGYGLIDAENAINTLLSQ